MSLSGRGVYAFGAFVLEPGERVLRRSGAPVHLPPKAFDLLVALVTRAGRLVTKEELLREVWPETFVEEANLSYTVSLVRSALGDDGDRGAYIETVPKQGYRFVAAVEEPPATTTPVAKRRLPAAAIAAGVALAVLGGLAWRARTPSPPSPVTLAVLPFDNLDGRPEREYLADGLTEDTIATLGRIDPPYLAVIGRTSTMAYKGTRKSLAAIGAELGVDYLLESTVRTEGGRLRVTSKLIRARDQMQVWTRTYDREPASLLELSAELSATVAEQVHLRLTPGRLNVLARRQTLNPEAYDVYLRGRYAWNQLTPSGTRQAVEHYARAAALDPDYALAWSGLADAYAASPINGDVAPRFVMERARDAAARAVAAQPALAEAQASVGIYKFWLEWDWPGAETALRQALALDPAYAVAPRLLGVVLSHMGRHDEAQATMARALELDPFAPNQSLSAQVAFSAREPVAVDFARRAIELDPGFWVAHYQLAQALEQAGRAGEALQSTQAAARLSGGNSKAVSLGGYVAARSGDPAAARAALATLHATSKERFVPPYAMALVHAGLGETDASFEWLEKALAAHDVHLVLLGVDPKWDAFRADPRFRDLLARCDFMRTAGSPAP